MTGPKALLAIAALGVGIASAQANCKKATITVASAAEATIACKTVEGSIVFDASDDLSGNVIISGPETVKGDIIIKNATQINALSSSTIAKIGGKFELQGLERLSSIDFTALQEVGEIEWITLPGLESVRFGTKGVTTIEKVRISDTFLSDLTGLSMASVGTFQIDNNRNLQIWETLLTNITEKLIVADNHEELAASFPALTWAAGLDVRGVKSLSVPLLAYVNNSMQLTENNGMESFIAPNLTETGKDLSFRNNDILSNISFPLYTEAGGSLVIQNNQMLTNIDGFPELEKVSGAITMRGNFTEFDLPVLDDVRGAFDVSSTEDISKSCEPFEELQDDGKIQGSDFECSSDNENANEGGKGSDDDEDAAGLLGINTPIVLGIALLGGLFQLL